MISATETASLVRSGMWLDYGITLCQPDVFDQALAARRESLENVKIHGTLTLKPRARCRLWLLHPAVARQIAAELRMVPASRSTSEACRMPYVLCSAESGVQDLGIHTEMLTDGLIGLYKAGRDTGSRKTLDPGKIVYTFALGSRYLHYNDQPESGLPLLSRGLHERAAHHHAE